jgi:hypothetical protein
MKQASEILLIDEGRQTDVRDEQPRNAQSRFQDLKLLTWIQAANSNDSRNQRKSGWK